MQVSLGKLFHRVEFLKRRAEFLKSIREAVRPHGKEGQVQLGPIDTWRAGD